MIFAPPSCYYKLTGQTDAKLRKVCSMYGLKRSLFPDMFLFICLEAMEKGEKDIDDFLGEGFLEKLLQSSYAFKRTAEKRKRPGWVDEAEDAVASLKEVSEGEAVKLEKDEIQNPA